jgi:hypothetical protein
VPHSLVVLGTLFLQKHAGARTRLTRELQESLADRMRVPVVTADELKKQYLFGRRDVVSLIGYLALVVVVYVLVLTHQDAVLRFSLGEWEGVGSLAKYVVAGAVFVFVPMVAFAYGRVARSFMKLIKME